MTTISRRPSLSQLQLSSPAAHAALTELTSAIAALQAALHEPDVEIYRASIRRAMRAVGALQRALGLTERTVPSASLH